MGKKNYSSYFDVEKQVADEAIETAEQVEAAHEEILPSASEEEQNFVAVEDQLAGEPEEPVVRRGKVISASGLNLRIGASVHADVVVVMPLNSIVTVQDAETDPDWYFVTTAEGKMGFALKKFIEA